LGGATVKRNQIWGDTVRFWQDVAQKSPNKARVHDHLGFWLSRAGRHEEAMQSFRQGLKLAPADFNLLMHLGASLTALGQLDEAAAAFERAVAVRPQDARSHANLATIRYRLGDVPSGRRAQDAAVALHPDHLGQLQLAQGIALTQLGRLEEALGVLRQAVRLLPGDPQAHNNLATTLLLLGDHEGGRRSLLQAIAIDPDYGSARYNLGCLLEREGRYAEALVEMQQALRITPGDRSLQDLVARLRQRAAR
jgi:Flp pilus assembly protein TadD